MNIFKALLNWSGVYRLYNRYLSNQIAKGPVPGHVGIILDGNRRWASERSVPLSFGHDAGAETATQLLGWCLELGIKIVTVYALSTENLTRPTEELNRLLDVIRAKLLKLLNDEKLHRNKVRVKGIGRLDLLPEDMRDLVAKLESTTAQYGDYFLNLALAYGGRLEIVDVVRKIVSKCSSGELDVESIDQKTVEDHLYTSHLDNPDPDLIVRTSGEERLSGFLLWQSAYSELVFLDVYWPDFRKIDLMRAVRVYQGRSRRFGK